jgi:dihydrodipicolinate synthase/N-acetylneuraminate lyase
MTRRKKYHGVVVPMITPFTSNGKIDEDAVYKITDVIISCGAFPFVIGTTGESASISIQEKLKYVEYLAKRYSGKTTLYAGISSNCQIESIEAAKKYFDLGIDVVVAALPSYYALTSDQMLKYFETIVENIPGPVTIYNILATTHMSIPLEVIEKLSYHPRIVALKDSERDIQRLNKSLEFFKEREDFSFLIGWAAQSAYGLLNGADGIIPSTGNIVPDMFQVLYEASIIGDWETANLLQQETDEIAKIYQKDRSLGHSLAALKVMMECCGLCTREMLPPLNKSNIEEVEVIKSQMEKIPRFKSCSK